MSVTRLTLSAVALLAGLGVAFAQQPPPVSNDQAKPAQAGKEEPSSRTPTGAEPVFVNGKLAVPGAPADGQTVPSKFSERNAKLDTMPIEGRIDISDEQKKQIAAAVATAKMPVSQINAKVGDMLPATTPVSEMPAAVAAAIPTAGEYSIIRTKDKILLVRANSMVVIGEIAVQ
jgi:hypothetical protein